MSNFEKNVMLIAALAVPLLRAQSATPVFEVASIRLCEGGDFGGKGGGGRGGAGGGEQGPSPDRLSMNCQPLRNLIRTAYVMFAEGRRMMPGRMTPIEGGPSWVDSDRYQITAKAEGTPGQEMMRGPMLQALLQDRFKLKIRRESREVPVYNLTVAKNGPKLQPSAAGSCVALEAFDFTKEPAPGQGPPPICAFRMLSRGKPNPTWQVRGATLEDLARARRNSLHSAGRANERPEQKRATQICGILRILLQQDRSEVSFCLKLSYSPVLRLALK